VKQSSITPERTAARAADRIVPLMAAAIFKAVNLPDRGYPEIECFHVR